MDDALGGTVLLVDWPDPSVPEGLARAGLGVVALEGPDTENDYATYEVVAGEVVRRPSAPPARADVLYAYRPLGELPGLVAMARELGARTLWLQSGLDATGAKDVRGCWLPDEDARAAREVVEAAGLRFVSEPFVVDAARS